MYERKKMECDARDYSDYTVSPFRPRRVMHEWEDEEQQHEDRRKFKKTQKRKHYTPEQRRFMGMSKEEREREFGPPRVVHELREDLLRGIPSGNPRVRIVSYAPLSTPGLHRPSVDILEHEEIPPPRARY